MFFAAFFSKQNKKKAEPRNDKEYANLHQRPNETDRNFMKRVNRVTKESVEEAKFEAKYGVDVVRNAKTGEIKLKKRPTNEIDERLKENAANLKKKGKVAKPVVIPADERMKLVKAMMQEKKEKEIAEKKPAVDEYKRDVIKFGEVVQAPPQLPVPRLAKKAETVPRVSKNLYSTTMYRILTENIDDFFRTLYFSLAKNHFFYAPL